MKITEYLPSVYNTLPDVLDADVIAKRGGLRDNFLKAARLCFEKHDARSDYLVILLHKHNVVKTDEVMLEDEERLKNGRIALTTRKAHLSERNSKHKPCKLKFVQGDVVPIEFSSDPEASLSYEKLGTKMAFLKEFGALLDEFNASNCFGLGMKNREISQSLPTGEVLVETIDTGRTANVLSPANATSAESAVDTSWSFEHNNIIVFGHYLATTVCVSRAPGHAEEPRHAGSGNVA